MAKKHISIIFCGGCNPKINRRQIAESVQCQFTQNGYDVSYNRPDADFVVYLSGCSVSCAGPKSNVEAQFIVVAGPSIESLAYEENSLANEILTRGRDYFEKL